MGQFSDDGEWWWDGTTWVATAQVVLPQLPPTEFEQSANLAEARSRMKTGGRLWSVGDFVYPLAALRVVAAAELLPAMSVYRSWKLAQLALATAYMLGPDEPMLAGEITTLTHGEGDPILAVAVTPAHVLVFRIDSLERQPRWIALAGRATDVNINVRTGIRKILLGPALIVTGRYQQLVIGGIWGMFKPEPLLDAWRQAANGISVS